MLQQPHNRRDSSPVIAKIWNRLAYRVGLQIRAAWCGFRAGKLPSDREFLKAVHGDYKSVDELLQQVCRRMSSVQLIPADQRSAYVATLQEHYVEQVDQTLAVADRILNHDFTLLSSAFKFGDEINWRVDPPSGRSWPQIYHEKIGNVIWSEKRPGDIKIPWELNRHQYFVTLGKAYWITADEKYADSCAKQILSWIRDNPRGLGINWYSALEIGLRLISWSLAFQFFRDSSCFISAAGKPFLISLFEQASFLQKNLTTTEEVRNNHILGEAAALIVVGSIFPEFKAAPQWLRMGLRIFEKELALQTYSDGANKEQAASYHQFVVDFLALIVVMGRRGIIPQSSKFDELLETMLDYVLYTMKPSGSMPMIGDADDGRGFILDETASFWDFRRWLALGAVLFDRSDYKYVAHDFGEEAFWLLGPEALSVFQKLSPRVPSQTSMAFPEAGHYIIRDGWTPHSDYAFFKCGTFGWGGNGFCAHSHCDLLAFELEIGGVAIVLDSGTYAYHGPWRDWFRLSAAHNVLMVDDRDQAIPLEYFGWERVPQAECALWELTRVAGAMDLASGLRHRRELDHPRPGLWNLSDSLSGEGTHRVNWLFHIAPELTCSSGIGDSGIVLEKRGRPLISITPPENVTVTASSGWISRSYGVKQQNVVLQGIWEGSLASTSVNFEWRFARVGK